MGVELWAAAMVVFGTAIGSFGPIFLKRSAKTFSFHPIKAIKNKNLVLGIFFYAIATIIFVPALKGGDLSILYPLVSTSYIFVSFYSSWLLKEKMDARKWFGILVIILGVFFIGLGS